MSFPGIYRAFIADIVLGIKIVFRCALIILKSALGKPEVVKKLPGMYETLEYIKKFDMQGWKPDALIHQVGVAYERVGSVILLLSR